MHSLPLTSPVTTIVDPKRASDRRQPTSPRARKGARVEEAVRRPPPLAKQPCESNRGETRAISGPVVRGNDICTECRGGDLYFLSLSVLPFVAKEKAEGASGYISRAFCPSPGLRDGQMGPPSGADPEEGGERRLARSSFARNCPGTDPMEQ